VNEDDLKTAAEGTATTIDDGPAIAAEPAQRIEALLPPRDFGSC